MRLLATYCTISASLINVSVQVMKLSRVNESVKGLELSCRMIRAALGSLVASWGKPTYNSSGETVTLLTKRLEPVCVSMVYMCVCSWIIPSWCIPANFRQEYSMLHICKYIIQYRSSSITLYLQHRIWLQKMSPLVGIPLSATTQNTLKTTHNTLLL